VRTAAADHETRDDPRRYHLTDDDDREDQVRVDARLSQAYG
jgi:hypothetical protein